MKVALVSSSYHPYYKGGGEHSVKVLAEQLAAKGVDIFVITAFHRAQTETINGVKVYRVRHPNVYWSYESERQPGYKKLAWHLAEGYNVRVAAAVTPILKQEKPDLLHIRNTEDFSPYVAKVARSLNIPVVVTLNSCTWLCPRGTMFRNGRNCPRQCVSCKTITYPKRRLSRYVNAVVGVSRFMIDVHTRYHYFPEATRQTIYTSVAPTPRAFPAAQSPTLRFGYLGRVHPIKGVAEIIRAFRAASPPRAQLYVAGDGPADYEAYCRTLAEGCDDIVFLGKSTPDEFYPQVDVVIVNSLVNEAFPRVLVEAYAYGRPVIAAQTGGTPEMVVAEQTGWTHDPFQPEQLEAIIKKVARLSLTELQQMQENIVAFLRHHLPDDTDQYLTLYRTLLNKP